MCNEDLYVRTIHILPPPHMRIQLQSTSYKYKQYIYILAKWKYYLIQSVLFHAEHGLPTSFDNFLHEGYMWEMYNFPFRASPIFPIIPQSHDHHTAGFFLLHNCFGNFHSIIFTFNLKESKCISVVSKKQKLTMTIV